MAGLALLLCAAGCGDEIATGPAAVTPDEDAALQDAAAMLDAREPPEVIPDEEATDSAEP